MKRLGKSAFTSITVSVILIAIVVIFGVLEANGNDSDLTYNSLDYDVTVEQNGDLRIRQTIDMKLDSRTDDDDNTVPWKQLYQQYTLNPSKLTNITDISVTNLSTGEKYSQIDLQSPSDVPLSTWNSKYARHWYIADVTDDEDDPQPFDTKTDGVASSADDDDAKTVEIGWNIPTTESRSSLRFQIDMTWEGVTTEYNDAAKFQWEPFGDSNPTPIKVMNTTVTLPEGANSKSMWAWLHYAGNSTTSHSGNKLQFTAYNVAAGQYLDMVVMVNDDLMKGVKRHNNSDTRQWTIDDETLQEQQWHERQHKRAVQRLVVWISFAVAGLALAIFGIYSAIKSVKASRYTGDITYWRDPPQMSPAAAARLYDVVAPGKKSGTLSNREMAATAMSLVSKGAIAIYPGSADTYRGIDMSRANSASLAQMISMQAEHNRKFSKRALW